jgi:hypothetical protein
LLANDFAVGLSECDGGMQALQAMLKPVVKASKLTSLSAPQSQRHSARLAVLGSAKPTTRQRPNRCGAASSIMARLAGPWS